MGGGIWRCGENLRRWIGEDRGVCLEITCNFFEVVDVVRNEISLNQKLPMYVLLTLSM